MKQKPESNLVQSHERLLVKGFKITLLLLWFMVIVYITFIRRDFAANSPTVRALLPFLWIVWAYMLIIFSIGSPDFAVSESGLNIKLPWRNYHLTWDDILTVRSDPLQSWIIVRKLTPFNYLIGFGIFSLRPAFPVGRWRKNYWETIGVIQAKTAEKKHKK